jgi:ABC-type branched-subunit amino acid transport system substrate-binding protein
MQRSRAYRVSGLLLGLSLVVAACGDDDDDDGTGDSAPVTADGTDTTAAPTETTAGDTGTTAAGGEATETTAAGGEGTETTTAATGEPGEPGALEGMKGTTPLPPELSQEFRDRLATTASGANLTDYNYAAESYDAVVLIALAAEAAGTDGSALAGEIVNVSREGEACSTFAECLPLVQDGTDINYEGVSGPNDLNGNGEPLTGTYGVLHFGADNRIDDSLTTNVSAQAPDSAVVDIVPVGVEREGNGVLKIGSLLPQTGDLAFLGPPEFAGVELAIADINEAGGVLGAEVEYSAGDSGDDKTDTANRTVDRLINQDDVDAIIGAAATGVTLNVIDTITQAGVVQFSPANTGVALTDKEDNGLYFRNAPPDSLQGPVIADLVLADGAETAYILARDDAYGNGLADVLEGVLNDSGVEVLDKVIYDPAAPSFDSEVNDIKSADPAAIIVIGFNESSKILRTMVEQGIGPGDKFVYGSDGNMGNALGEDFDAGR